MSEITSAVGARTTANIVIVSDGIGDTAREIADCGMSQFEGKDVSFDRHINVRSVNQIDSIFSANNIQECLVLYTLVEPSLRAHIAKLSIEKKVHCIDLLGPVLEIFAKYFGERPSERPGLHRRVNEEYFDRVAAMEFTLLNDDGKNLKILDSADLILVGISRTSKTPLSLYLAQQYSMKVVNVPLILNTPPPSAIFKVDQRKIFALTIDPYALREIRRNRLSRLGANECNEHYAGINTVQDESKWAEQLFNENKKWTKFDVTNKAIEETAAEIMRVVDRRKHNIFSK